MTFVTINEIMGSIGLECTSDIWSPVYFQILFNEQQNRSVRKFFHLFISWIECFSILRLSYLSCVFFLYFTLTIINVNLWSQPTLLISLHFFWFLCFEALITHTFDSFKFLKFLFFRKFTSPSKTKRTIDLFTTNCNFYSFAVWYACRYSIQGKKII